GYGKRLLADIDFSQIPGKKPELGAWILTVPANARYAADAQAFIDFATSKEQLDAAAKVGNPPPLRSTLENPKALTEPGDHDPDPYPTFKHQLVSLMNARPRPRTPYWREVEQVLGRCLSAVYESAITSNEAIDRVNSGLEAAMAGQSVQGFSCMK